MSDRFDHTLEHTLDTKADANADAGLDVKFGVTESLFADFTVNTDFAQVEADEQQVNLTRFEISFPEKREFFLEGAEGATAGEVRTDCGGCHDHSQKD